MTSSRALERGSKLVLTCYNDTYRLGWRHVDLFIRDAQTGREISWVYWNVAEDGPDEADRSTLTVEPKLARISEWRHGISAGGMDYWEADAAWMDEE